MSKPATSEVQSGPGTSGNDARAGEKCVAVSAAHERAQALRRNASALFRNHPALAGTAAYLCLTAVGMIYEVAFFSKFHLRILELADAGDFLLVAFREPLLLAITVLSGWLLVGAFKAHATGLRTSAGYRRLTDWMESNRLYLSVETKVYGLMVVLYFELLASIYASYNATEIRRGHGRMYRVEWTGQPEAAASKSEPPRCALLGATSRYVLLFDPKTGLAFATPVANIARLTPAP
jgi:hypothetical protein